jgi:FG-GAP-like repeat/FG-GAP repeat
MNSRALLAVLSAAVAVADCGSNAVVSRDGGSDAGGRDGAGTVVASFRLIAPLSTATVTSRRPTLHWALGVGDDGAHVQICRDRACSVEVTSFDASGTSGAPADDLPVGVAFWRATARGGDAATATSTPTWQFTVGALSAPVDTSWGSTLDVNGDGFADVIVGAYVHLGGPDGPATLPSTTLLTPLGATLAFQSASAGVGDVNGDGYGDLVTADPNFDQLNGTFGAYVYLGSASGLSLHPALVIREIASLNAFSSVAGAGDLNGDGYADIVLGDQQSGAALVYLGSASGPSANPDVTLTNPGGRTAYSVASAGDVNGDGYEDILIGALDDGSSSTPDIAYIYLGSATGPSTTPLVALTADVAGTSGGTSVACAGDVNGDGYADLLVGTPNGQTGGAFLYLGSPTGPSATPSLTYAGLDGLFGFASTGVGDVNGDGYADFVIGDPGGQDPSVNIGSAFLYLGGTTAPTTAAVTLTNPDSTGVTVPFVNMAGAGDVNGDGYADFVTTVSGARQFGYVYFGGAGGLAATPAKMLD